MNDDLIKKMFNENKYDSIINNVKKIENLCPKFENIFNAFKWFDLKETKVVIIGQDPYHLKGVADGLAFSTKKIKTPKSLQNIFKELRNEYHDILLETNDLTPWAKQGVLLLNTSLTTIENHPNYHQNIGWYDFVINLIRYIDRNCSFVVFNLWGKEAQKLEQYILSKNHLILKTSHPSPLSANKGFLGSNVFKKTNEFLSKKHQFIIDWNLKKE